MGFRHSSQGAWFNASTAQQWTQAAGNYGDMARRVPSAARSAGEHLASQVAASMAEKGHTALAAAIGVVEKKGNLAVGLPTGHELTQYATDVEFGGLVSPPEAHLRKHAVWNPGPTHEVFRQGLAGS